MNLHLNLTKKWFDRHLQDKTEEYRAITPYWCNKLLRFFGQVKPRQFWKKYANNRDILDRALQSGEVSFIPYTVATFSNGMKAIDKLPRFKKSIKEMGVWQGRPEWGADPNTFYFVIRCGEAYGVDNYKKLIKGLTLAYVIKDEEAQYSWKGLGLSDIITQGLNEKEKQPASTDPFKSEFITTLTAIFDDEQIRAINKLQEEMKELQRQEDYQRRKNDELFIIKAIEYHIQQQLTEDMAKRITMATYDTQPNLFSYWLDFNTVDQKKLFTATRMISTVPQENGVRMSTFIKIIESCLD